MVRRFWIAMLFVGITGTAGAQSITGVYELEELTGGSATNPTDWSIPDGWSRLQISPHTTPDGDPERAVLLVLYDDGSGYLQRRTSRIPYGEREYLTWELLPNDYVRYDMGKAAYGGLRPIGLLSPLPTPDVPVLPVVNTFAQEERRIEFFGEDGVSVDSSTGIQNFTIFRATWSDSSVIGQN